MAKIINDIIGPYAKLSNGRFYPLLAKMEKDGLIIVQPEPTGQQHSERPSRRYAITDKGRGRFQHVMLDTTSNPGEYQKIFTLKFASMDFLTQAERLSLIEHYIHYCHSHILHSKAEVADLLQSGPSYELSPNELDVIIQVQDHMREQWQLELDWATKLHQQELSAAKCSARLEPNN